MKWKGELIVYQKTSKFLFFETLGYSPAGFCN